MQIQELKLLNFRNYEKVQVAFHKHLNIIYGKNGSGKTNLVEAIYVLALSRSFKQNSDKTLKQELKNEKNFNTVKIAGLSIEWANGVDICPNELYNNSKKEVE